MRCRAPSGDLQTLRPQWQLDGVWVDGHEHPRGHLQLLGSGHEGGRAEGRKRDRLAKRELLVLGDVDREQHVGQPVIPEGGEVQRVGLREDLVPPERAVGIGVSTGPRFARTRRRSSRCLSPTIRPQ